MTKIKNRAAARNLKPGTWITRLGCGETVVIVSRYDSHHDWYTCHEVDWNEDDGSGVETERVVHLTSSDLVGGTIDCVSDTYIKTDSGFFDVKRDYEIVAHADRSRPGVKWLDEGWLVRYAGDLFFLETDEDITDDDWRAWWSDWSSICYHINPADVDPEDDCKYYFFKTNKEVEL